MRKYGNQYLKFEFREEGMEHGKIKGRLMKVAELSNQEKLMAAGYKEA